MLLFKVEFEVCIVRNQQLWSVITDQCSNFERWLNSRAQSRYTGPNNSADNKIVTPVHLHPVSNSRNLFPQLFHMNQLSTKLFQDVYKECADQILNFLWARVGKNDVEDLAQEVWLRFSESIDGLEPDSNHQAFIFRIASNLVIDQYRKAKVPVGSINQADGDIDIYDDRALEMLSKLIDDETLRALWSCLESLQPERQIVVLLRLEGMTYEEIYEELNREVKKETLMTRYDRAKTDLRDCIERKMAA